MNRVFRGSAILLTLLSVFCWTACSRAADANAEKDQAADIDELVEQITDGGDLRAATEHLLKLGKPAVAPLAKAAEVENPAVVTRCFDVLSRLLVSDDQETAQAAQEALEKLSDSEIDLVGRRARNTLRLKDIHRQREALLKGAQIARGGATNTTSMTISENGRTTQLKRAANGSFSGTVKEMEDGKEKVTPITAESEKELEEKYPDVHKAYKKQQQQQQAVPGMRPGLQINGQAFGGGGNQTMNVTINNNQRRIEAESGGEKVEITDTAGKNIELKHTRQVDGKEKIDEYKADDLDDLQKKHPEAAKLYEKYTAGQKFGVGPGGVIQMQIGGGFQGGIGGPVVRPIPGFRPALPAPPQTDGSRTIRSELNGRKIEITDTDGTKIRIKLTKMVEGKEVAQEFTADDLKTLKSEHPEVARLYEQLPGRKE